MSANGIAKKIVIGRESSWGTKAANNVGKELPRNTGVFNLEKDAYNSALIDSSQQLRDSSFGTSRATGNLTGDLMCGSYSDLFAALLRKNFSAVAITITASTISISDVAPQFQRSAGSFIADGFKVGMVVAASGLVETDDIGKPAVITEVTDTGITVIRFDGEQFTDEAAGTAITIAQIGKHSFIPTSGHTNDSFTVEEWQSDISVSLITLGQQVNDAAVAVTPNSMATVAFNFLGKNSEESANAAYFISPTPVPANGTFTAPKGLALVDGVPSCRVTSFNLNISGAITQESLVACDGIGASSRAKVLVSGSMTVLFEDGYFDDLFRDEIEIPFFYGFQDSDGKVLGFYLPRMKVGSATRDDGEKVIIQTVNFTAILYAGSDADQIQTTLLLSDTSL